MVKSNSKSHMPCSRKKNHSLSINRSYHCSVHLIFRILYFQTSQFSLSAFWFNWLLTVKSFFVFDVIACFARLGFAWLAKFHVFYSSINSTSDRLKWFRFRSSEFGRRLNCIAFQYDSINNHLSNFLISTRGVS